MSVSNISVVPVRTRRDLRRFARFNVKFYKDNPYSVPDLIGDTKNSFTPSRNAAFEFCEAQPFIALIDGKVVGRVAAIINHKANDVWNVRTVRFGWIDFIDDIRVSEALLNAVAEWGKERGMNRLEGPFGFTDFDPEGMLTDGFDRISTMATIYNYPYYPEHMKRLGLETSAKWVEWFVHFPNPVPEKIQRLSKIVMERYNLHLAVYGRSKTKEARKYAYKLFRLVNEAYAPLYGYSAFSEKQIDIFVRRYLFMLDRKFVTILLDSNDDVVACALTMPSIAMALHKSQGRLFPFGWWRILSALRPKSSSLVEMLFVAVKPEYQDKGVLAILTNNVTSLINSVGCAYGESNPELETNVKMQSLWSYFPGSEIVRRRAVFYRMI
ncbi:MAG: GNAT family N-acetyltransferase [Bacteroidaceae bacterium]|nr:GNAT family N-acetyltransferase [Bacteroidaceae bacterium]